MLHRILVAFDGSPQVEAVLDLARAVAAAFQGEIVLLRVVDSESHEGPEVVDTVTWNLRCAQTRAYVAGIQARLAESGTVATGIVAEGRAPDAIIDAAAARGCDLVVLGTHGRGGSLRYPLGGTAQKVIARSPVSVLAVPIGRETPAVHGRRPRILLPIDCSLRSRWALAAAEPLARVRGAEVVLLHVVGVPEMAHHNTPLDRGAAELQSRVVERNRRAAAACLERTAAALPPDVPWRTRVEVSPRVGAKLEQVAAEESPDLVILTAHGSGSEEAPSPALHGSIARHFLSGVPFPVLVLQDVSDRSGRVSFVSRSVRRAPALAMARPPAAG